MIGEVAGALWKPAYLRIAPELGQAARTSREIEKETISFCLRKPVELGIQEFILLIIYRYQG